VPTGKYVNLSVRREVREELDRLREEVKINNLNDLLILLVRTYREHTNTVSKFEELLTNAVSKAVKEALQHLTNTISKAPADHTNTVSKQRATGSGKKSAIEVLRDAKVRCISDMRGARNPEAIIEKMRAGGAVVVRTDEDVCAVDLGFWDLFKRKLNESKTPDDREVLSRLRDEKMKRLFQLLRRAGALYLDVKSREWVYDYSLIEEPEGDRRREEEIPVDWELE
jgi:hypothetical protein